MKRVTIILLTGMLAAFSSVMAAPQQADLILYNGKVITVDAGDHFYQAVAVEGEKILAVGSNLAMRALAAPGCRLVDLQGKCVSPGLIDSHYHLMYYGAQFWPGYLNIRHPVVTSKAELLQVVGDYAKTLDSLEWVSGNQGFTVNADETVDRYDLDSVTPKNPVYLRHSSGQYSVVNSLSLDIAGIDSSTVAPVGSLIMKDSTGQPSGILSHYPAENLVGRYATGYGDRSDEEKYDDIERGQNLCLEAGYTSIQDVIIGNVQDVRLYKQFADSGRLKVRLYMMLYLDYEQQADSLIKKASFTDSKMAKFLGWKLAMDGGIAARTTLLYNKSLFAAQLSYPYHSQAELNRIVQKLHDTGLQVAIHVGGDEGIDMCLTAFEEAIKTNPRSDPRHRIEHGLFPLPAALPRFKNAGIILSTQPQWITWYGDGYATATDALTMSHLLPLKTMLGMGIPIAFGCDVPASSYQEPKWAFKGATLRRTTIGTPLTLAERINMPEALRIHTMGSAYAAFMEDSTGSIEPGKYADLTVWSHDLYNMNPDDSNELASLMTIVGGQILYDSGALQVTQVDADGKKISIPAVIRLRQNYPNPFNARTRIAFEMPKAAVAEIAVFDRVGQRVRLLSRQRYGQGVHALVWDGRDDLGMAVPSGMYVCQMRCEGLLAHKKLMVLR